VRSAPSSVRLCGRVPENDVVLEGGRVGFTNFSAGIMVLDPRTDEYRESRVQDVADLARMTDYLSEIDTYEHAVEGRDAPEQTLAIRDAAVGLKNTTKCVGTGALSTYDVDAIVRMGAAVAGGEDALRERPSSTSASARSARSRSRATHRGHHGLGPARHPQQRLSMAMSGGSSPVTLAGTLVIHNCEVLAGLTLAQLTERGAPTIYGSSTTAMDLRSRRPPSARPSSACSAPASRRWRSATCCRASWRGCRRTRSSVTSRPVTRRP
jgi:trimethylamine---corrinoid protein Co-methyltransferase